MATIMRSIETNPFGYNPCFRNLSPVKTPLTTPLTTPFRIPHKTSDVYLSGMNLRSYSNIALKVYRKLNDTPISNFQKVKLLFKFEIYSNKFNVS